MRLLWIGPCQLQAGTQEAEPGPMGVGEQGQTSTWAGMAGSNVEKKRAKNKAKGRLGRGT